MRVRVPFLFLCCGGLGWLAVSGDAGMRALPVPAAAIEAPPSRPAIRPLPAAATGPWTEQLSRPLFTASRRPPEVESSAAVAEMPEPEPPPPVAASGVILRAEGAMALLRLADDRTTRAVEGEEIEGWRVVRIFAEGVDIARGERTLTLPARIPAAEGLARGE